MKNKISKRQFVLGGVVLAVLLFTISLSFSSQATLFRGMLPQGESKPEQEPKFTCGGAITSSDPETNGKHVVWTVDTAPAGATDYSWAGYKLYGKKGKTVSADYTLADNGNTMGAIVTAQFQGKKISTSCSLILKGDLTMNLVRNIPLDRVTGKALFAFEVSCAALPQPSNAGSEGKNVLWKSNIDTLTDSNGNPFKTRLSYLWYGKNIEGTDSDSVLANYSKNSKAMIEAKVAAYFYYKGQKAVATAHCSIDLAKMP